MLTHKKKQRTNPFFKLAFFGLCCVQCFKKKKKEKENESAKALASIHSLNRDNTKWQSGKIIQYSRLEKMYL